MNGIPRVALSWVRTGVTLATQTAAAVTNAIARAGALRRVLIGVPCKDISMCTDARETIDANPGGQRGLRSRPSHDDAAASKLANAAVAGRTDRGRSA